MVLNTTTIGETAITPLLTFSWLDYVVFAAMLAVSGLIGIYYGCFGNKQNTTNEYLLGGKRMHIFPIAMSIIASNVSGLAVLGVPSDVYRYGAVNVLSLIPIVVSSLATIYVYMPVFLELELITIYQYLNIRFGSTVKNLASFTYIFHLVIYNPVVIFLPCLAFNQVTGYNINFLAPTTTIFCVFYTAIGGLKTVVWTDTFQTISILIGTLVVFFMGFYSTGDISRVFQIAEKGERLDVFNFNFDPTIRDTFWTYAFGCTCMWLMDVAINQSTLQRLNAVPTFAKAKTVILVFGAVSAILKIITVVIGINIYSRYADCDPLQSGKVNHVDQVVPYYVIDVAGSILGLPGLFIAGIFAAGLSTVSTNLLNLSTVIYTDFLSKFLSKSMSQTQISYILKIIVVVVGVVDCGLIFLVSKFGGMLQFGISLIGVTYGTLLGLFTFGMVFPIANKQGALCGGIAGLIFSAVMVFGNLWYTYKGVVPAYTKPFSTDGCTVTSANVTRNIVEGELPPAFFRISFWLYPFYGCLAMLAVGLPVSYLTRKTNAKIRPELISPMFQFMLPKQQLREGATYHSINNDIVMKNISNTSEKKIDEMASVDVDLINNK